VFGRNVLRKIFKPSREEVNEYYGNLHNEEIYDLCKYENIFPYFAPFILETVNWMPETFLAMMEQIIQSGHLTLLKYTVETATLHASTFSFIFSHNI
jgi:hypothetical protein